MAQSVGVLLTIFTAVAPAVVVARVSDATLSATLTALAVFAFWLLNEAAREIEDPFLYAPNALPLCHMHAVFLKRLVAARASAAAQRASVVRDAEAAKHAEAVRDSCMREASLLTAEAGAPLLSDVRWPVVRAIA